MTGKITEIVAKEKLFEKHSDKIILLEYESMTKRAKFKCFMCNNEWNTSAELVINRGYGCPNCERKNHGNNARLSYCFVFEYIKDKDCLLLSKEYNGIDDILEIKFQCGHIGKFSFRNFKRNLGCKICKGKNGKYHSYKEKDFNKDFSEYGLTFIKFIDGCFNQDSRFEYECEFGHINTRTIKQFRKNKRCPDCAMIAWGKRYGGRNGINWKGGVTQMGIFFRQIIKGWKLESAKKYNYRCAITGEIFDEIHHLHPLHLIIKEALSELNLESKETMAEYTDDELLILSNKLIEVHNRYPLGVPLTFEAHKKFHNIYSYTPTPENFYEFQQNIKSGNIIIS